MNIKLICDTLEYCANRNECAYCPCGGSLEECNTILLEGARQLRTQQATIRSLLKATEYHRQMNGALLKAVDGLTEASAFRED
jgi:hypothetical protein|nr:MAG TPA: hypothetical protein [Herelleviridae sp.]